MLVRHIIGYIPSLLVPALASFIAIYCYTRLLTPHEYGYYALSVNVMVLLNTVFFYWLQISLPRLMPQARKEGRAAELSATTYAAFGVVSIGVIICAVIFMCVVPLGDLKLVAWLAVPMALARSLLNMNQAFHRSALDFKRYNFIECGQAVFGLCVGLVLVYFFHMNSFGSILGLTAGLVIMVAADMRIVLATPLKYFNRAALREILHFGLPLVVIFGFTFILSASDRFLIEYFKGESEVGIYSAGYGVMDRIMQIVFMLVATPSFPLVIHRFEHEGLAAARTQTYDNGIAILMLGLPACAGLILCNLQISTVLIGPEFREGAMQIMPCIAIAALLGGLSVHYFDHAFHLAKKPYLLFFTQGPAALFNVVCNCFMIPRYGFMGAAYTAVASYALLLVLSIFVGRRIFPVYFPVKPAVHIVISTLLMMLPLALITFPATMPGLIVMVMVGGAVYGAGLLVFNVMGIRSKIQQIIRSR